MSNSLKNQCSEYLLEQISAALSALHEKKPLVHHITNDVTVNDCANITLAIGGSPVMAPSIDESAEMAACADALVLNIGTLDKRSIESMIHAAKAANELSIPVVLDPVGVGATALRTESARKLIENARFAVVRGNASEIMLLAGECAGIKGVDSSESGMEALGSAIKLSKSLSCTVAVTGAVDIIVSGEKAVFIKNGTPMLSRVTGTGCMCTSLIGAFCGSIRDPFIGAAAGIMSMGISGEVAKSMLKEEEGTGTFRIRLFDSVSNLTPQRLREMGDISCEK
ncbi:hydroxyethylthiazole kinase ThiM [Peptoclostridium acidaminophilum DSM 3953]|uniref:Hydroxyethylthiazole kinase n=1 Tax=Peptoclostridium acidaminophilum DSM 3953 TaxID=1286171 RepID=W8THS4_PEPAC|nr:hydroxyethylthiazole kinase [Peptoclostridium acidaminophilum]AHM57393.1 hydroxyethylthiazole kinase ThiM [Peptoclostridium acidaminophilum DSM 3953]